MQQNDAPSAPVYVTADALMANGVGLEDALIIACDAGADGFELRRERLNMPLKACEVQHLRELLARFPSPPIYSTGQALCCDQRHAREAIRTALDEAAFWGCPIMKCPLGDISDLSPHDLAALQQTLQDWSQQRPEVRLAVENAPVGAHTDIAQWEQFFAAIREAGAAVGMTFDLGNWQGDGVDVVAAAHELGRFVVYAHVKAVAPVGDHWQPQPVCPAQTQHPALEYLPQSAPRAIEFPIPGAPEEIRDALQGYVAIIRSGDFAL